MSEISPDGHWDSKYKLDKIYLALFHKKELIRTFVKKKGFKKIKVVKIPKSRIGIAINDRLKKAAN